MKFLLITIVVVLIAWQWRTSRAARQLDALRKQSAKPGPVAMVLCGHCGVHVPENDAVAGQHGAYCCPAHRQTAER